MKSGYVQNQFSKFAKLIWECGCGNQSFYLHNDGTVSCVDCGSQPPIKTTKNKEGADA